MNLPDGYSDVPDGKIAAVVTHLQMLRRPMCRAEVEGSWRLRHVTAPDLNWFRDLYRRIGENWLWFVRLQMTDEQLTERLFLTGKEIHVLSDGGCDEGLLELQFRDPRDCEVVFFGVTSKLLGSGAGRWLMNRALDLAWSRPIDRLWLHTCTFDHPAALSFYQRSGFQPFRRQIEIADDPRLSGTLPLCAAPHIPMIEAQPTERA
jgi:GNAT superfamily N-acetyltransferase